MTINRRAVLLGLGSLGTILGGRGINKAAARTVHEVEMTGLGRGKAFSPVGLLVEPGDTVRWVNADKSDSHTIASYHPENFGRVLRIPENATPWRSELLVPGDTFEWEFTVPGVYDYYSIAHEDVGMVGRIVVDGPGAATWTDYEAQGDLPEAAISRFPKIADILHSGEIG